MQNAKMYCLCLHNRILPIIKKLGYAPVGVGNDKFSGEWLKDDTLENICSKNKYYSEYTFHYWFWKNILPTIEDNHWIGFCAYRDYWSKKKEITQSPNFEFNEEEVPNVIRTDSTRLEDLVINEIPIEWENYDTIIGTHHYINNLKLSKLIKHGIWSLKAYIQGDCKLFRYKIFSDFPYKKPMGEGTASLSTNKPDKEWQKAPPNSSTEDLLNAVCKHKN